MTGGIRCRISGRVQGVWFRDSTRRQARRLGLTGHAHNLPDGQVEVLAFGTEPALASLQAWLWQGPEQARIERVDCEPVAHVEPPADFTIG